MRSVLSKVGIFALALVGVGTLAAWRGGGFGGMHGGWGMGPPDPARIQRFVSARLDDALDDLNARPDQRAKIHAVKDGLLKEGIALMPEHHAVRAQALAEWDKDQPDQAKLDGLVDARIDAFRAFAHKVVAGAVQVHQILDPAQRAQVSKRAHRHIEE
jgi:Spy/CpxP family protein refolding chaperone